MLAVRPLFEWILKIRREIEHGFATRKVRPIAKLEKSPHVGLAISPDNRWLLYTQMDQRGSDIMLIENFR